MGLRDLSQSGKIWVSETSLSDLFYTFPRLVSVKVENQFLRLEGQEGTGAGGHGPHQVSPLRREY